MSLELAINENTQAVKALAELMLKLTSGAAVIATNTTQAVEATKTVAKAAVEKAAVEKAAVEKAAVEKAAVEKAAVEKAAVEKAAATPAQVKEEAAAVTYDDVKKAILAYQTANGREATIAALKSFGAAKGTDLKPEQYAEALALFTA